MDERQHRVAALWLVLLLAFSMLPAFIDFPEPGPGSDHSLSAALHSVSSAPATPVQVDALAAWDSGACLNLVDQGLGVLHPQAESKRLVFDRDPFPVKHVEDISSRMAGGQDDSFSA